MRYHLHKRLFFKIESAEDWLWKHAPQKVWLAFPSRALNKVACLLLGHVPISDQCCNPEHDFCAYCQKSTPGEA